MDFVIERTPPEDRTSSCDGSLERHLPEAAVMLAVTRWLFEQGALSVSVHPDGMHVKDFDVAGWLHANDFNKTSSIGKTRHGGVYECGQRTVEVRFQPGCGDVVAQLGPDRVVVEAKGGCLNSLYPGLKSKLRRHLYEAVGSLFDPPEATRLIAAVPRHPETEKLASRMAPGCYAAGIEIALVSACGIVELADPQQPVPVPGRLT